MNAISKSVMTLALLAGAAHGQVPASNDTSDVNFNTGMGTGALGTAVPLNPGTGNTAAGYRALISNAMGGSYNTAVGNQALNANTTGSYNTASGYVALYPNTTGNFNTATGIQALYSNTTGIENTAVGGGALYFNTTGAVNTAVGVDVLTDNTSGSNNSALGAAALTANTTGSFNTAIGVGGLELNTSGAYNTANGYEALINNSIGYYNTAIGANALNGAQYPTYGTGSHNTGIGAYALYSYSTGSSNTASGASALHSDTTGSNNAAYGQNALYSVTSGSNNIAVGDSAGYNLTTGANNIDVGNEGFATDGGVIRIGTTGTQTATHIAGIFGTSITGGVEVVINAKGQLGVKTSSRRYKDDIRSIGDSSDGLYQLHPVTFRYKEPEPDGLKPIQYGLIAEEVAKVYPELVIRDERGEIQGVRYDELAPMLLNEMQKDHATVETLVAQHSADTAKIASLEQQLTEIRAALLMQPKKDQLVAQR